LIIPFSASTTANVTCVLGVPWILPQMFSTCWSRSAALSDWTPFPGSVFTSPPCSTAVSAFTTRWQSSSCCRGVALCASAHRLNSSTAPSRSSLRQKIMFSLRYHHVWFYFVWI
jgi:hypothetical protein